MLEYIIYTNNIYKGVGGMSQSISDVAKLYNVSINTIGYHMKRNELEFEYIGGKRFISDEHIKQLSNYINVQHTSNESSNDNKNTTNESNNVVEILQSHIDEQRNTIRDLSRMLDQQQQLTQSSNKKIHKLENEIEQYKFKLEDSSNSKRVLKVKSRVKVNDVEDVEDTNESSNDPIEDTKEAVENKKRKPWWKLW